jgi:hypothetical protein
MKFYSALFRLSTMASASAFSVAKPVATMPRSINTYTGKASPLSALIYGRDGEEEDGDRYVEKIYSSSPRKLSKRHNIYPPQYPAVRSVVSRVDVDRNSWCLAQEKSLGPWPYSFIFEVFFAWRFRAFSELV